MPLIEVPKHDIIIPEGPADKILADLDKPESEAIAQVRAMFPIKLARGVPPFVHGKLIAAAETKFLQQFPQGIPTYAHQSHPDTPEANAFRGDPEFINLAIHNAWDEYELEITAEQIVTGSAGGQALVTGILDYLIFKEGRNVATTELTFDRTKRHLNSRLKRLGEVLDGIPLNEDGSGINVAEACERLTCSNSALFMVRSGSNPDGATTATEDVVTMAKIAQEHNNVIVLDEAYADLYFPSENSNSLNNLQEFVDNGTIVIVFTCTKEGGHRGAAYAIGDAKRMSNILKDLNDRRLCPNYATQRRQALLETFPDKELGDIVSFSEFLKKEIRPTLALGFATVKRILSDGNVRLSNPEVAHGYNVAVYFPEDATEEQTEQFFRCLKGHGINSPDLSAFIVKSNKQGFRIPFGGFTAEQLTVVCHLIVAVHQMVWPQ